MSLQSSDNNYKVYKHTCPNGKVYIGITKDKPEKRWMSGWGYKTCIYFFKAIVKYGWINIKHEILFENLTKKEAEQKEIELISAYNSCDRNFGYNIDLGGSLHLKYQQDRADFKTFKAGIVTAEREKLMSVEYKSKITGHKVYKYSMEGDLIQIFDTCKEAAADANVPYSTFQRWVRGKHPKNAKYKYTYGSFDNAGKKYKQTFNAKPVDMFDLNLKLIRVFPSLTEAGRYIASIYGSSENTARSNIHSTCNGAYSNGKHKRLTAYNYIWRYHNEDTDTKVA